MIITITGNNDYRRSTELTELQQKFVQLHGEASVERLSGEEIETGQLLDALQAQSLFATDRLVIVRGLSLNKPVAANLEAILEAAAGDGVTLVLHEPTLDMRTGYAKTLQKQTDWRKFDELRDFELVNWLKSEAKVRSGSIDGPVAEHLVQRVGASQQLLSSELDKLMAFDPVITGETVKLLTEPSPQSSIFELLNAAFRGDKKVMIQLYREQRAQSVEPQAILSMIAWQLHTLLVIKVASGQSPDAIAKEAGISPYVVRNSAPLAQKLSRTRLKELIEGVVELEITSKSKAINIDDAVQALLLKISE